MITLQNGALTVTDWSTRDLDIVRLFSDVEAADEQALECEREDLFLRALKVGAVALQRAQVRTDVDTIRREFEAWKGQLMLALDGYLGQSGQLGNLFSPTNEDGPIVQIRAAMDGQFGEGARFEKLLDWTEGDSPLRKLRDDISATLKVIEDRIIDVDRHVAVNNARAIEAEFGTRQGFDFQNLVFDVLNDIAARYRDSVEDVSNLPTADNSRTGDALVRVARHDAGVEDAYIVIEAKKTDQGLHGKNGMLAELTKALEVRKARYAIGVYRDTDCPREVRHLRLFDDNRIVCSITADGRNTLALELAYMVARAELCCQLQHGTRAVGHATVVAGIKRVQEKMERFRSLIGSCNTIQRTAEDVRRDLEQMQREMKSELANVLDELVTEPEV